MYAIENGALKVAKGVVVVIVKKWGGGALYELVGTTLDGVVGVILRVCDSDVGGLDLT